MEDLDTDVVWRVENGVDGAGLFTLLQRVTTGLRKAQLEMTAASVERAGVKLRLCLATVQTVTADELAAWLSIDVTGVRKKLAVAIQRGEIDPIVPASGRTAARISTADARRFIDAL